MIADSGAQSIVPVALGHAGWIGIDLRRRLGSGVPGIVVVDWVVSEAPAALAPASGYNRRMIARLVLLLVAVAAEPAVAASFFLSHAYGELVDRGPVTAELQDARFGCAPPVTIRKRDGAISMRSIPGKSR